jgi:hypothetical protein
VTDTEDDGVPRATAASREPPQPRRQQVYGAGSIRQRRRKMRVDRQPSKGKKSRRDRLSTDYPDG